MKSGHGGMVNGLHGHVKLKEKTDVDRVVGVWLIRPTRVAGICSIKSETYTTGCNVNTRVIKSARPAGSFAASSSR